MPEGPEVLLTSQFIDYYVKSRRLLEINILSGRYQNKSPDGYDEFIDNLPMVVRQVSSKGKFLWFSLTNKAGSHYIWNTFGMTGTWTTYQDRHSRIEFVFSRNKRLYFNDMRNFGTVKFDSNRQNLDNKLAKIAPDFIQSNVDITPILDIDKPIVAILMDQTKIGSGIGNYLVAEILYRAKISPHRHGTSFDKKELKRLDRSIKYTMKLAYCNNSTGYMESIDPLADKLEKRNYHRDIKIKRRKFRFQVYGQTHDPYGNPVKKDHIVGTGSNKRTTYWVPLVQH